MDEMEKKTENTEETVTGKEEDSIWKKEDAKEETTTEGV